MDWECGGRDKATCERLLERLRRWRTRLYCADDYAVYGVLLPVGQLYTGQEETHGVERDNARQRHWLARFRRRSIVVSKTKRMVDVRRQVAGWQRVVAPYSLFVLKRDLDGQLATALLKQPGARLEYRAHNAVVIWRPANRGASR